MLLLYKLCRESFRYDETRTSSITFYKNCLRWEKRLKFWLLRDRNNAEHVKRLVITLVKFFFSWPLLLSLWVLVWAKKNSSRRHGITYTIYMYKFCSFKILLWRIKIFDPEVKGGWSNWSCTFSYYLGRFDKFVMCFISVTPAYKQCKIRMYKIKHNNLFNIIIEFC